MSAITITMTANDLIDDLGRRFFNCEPDAIAALAHDDPHTRARRLPMTAPTTDPLDGLEVIVRRVLDACLAIKKRRGAVSLLTERQARAAGWPSGELANRVVLLAWALAISEPGMEMPVLLAPDETAKGAGRLVRAKAGLRSYEQLRAALRPSRRSADRTRAGSERALQGAPVQRGQQLVSLDEVLRSWLGVDAMIVELPGDTDFWAPRLTSPNARAAGVIAWIINEVLDLADVMEDEDVSAVRIKTDTDARLAAAPGAAAANLALLLGAAAYHGTGYTVTFLPPAEGAAEALVEAGRVLANRDLGTDADLQIETAELLELEDLARGRYVHVGRRAAKRVALRRWDEARPVRAGTAGEAAR